MRRKALSLVALVAALVALVNARPALDDNVDVKIDGWLTPSKPAYPHDPAVAPDGTIWYSGQRANVIGRFDPKMQQFKEWPCPTPNSGPHGIIADKDGDIWYTGNAAGLIGRLNPKTEKITEYKMPDAKARDPH